MRNKTKIISATMIAVLALSVVTAVGIGAFGQTLRPLVDGLDKRDFKHEGAGSPMRQREEEVHMPKMTALAFHDDWRRLWEDHIWWTRMVIIGVFDDLGGSGNYTERLLQNYVDMQDTLRPFYGDGAVEFGNLTRDHLLIAAEILFAAKEGNSTKVDDAVARWYVNADEIAEKMHELNPRHWPLGEAKAMWKEHLDLTLEEALAHLSKNWAGDVEAFEKVHLLALEMADFFSEGIVLQFPDMFKMLGTIVKS